MVNDYQQAVKLHKTLTSGLLEAETLVAKLVKTLNSNNLRNVAQIYQNLEYISSNNQKISNTLLQVSTTILANERQATSPEASKELATAMSNSAQIRDWIMLWPKVEQLVRLQVPAKKLGLFSNNSAASDISISQFKAYDAAFDFLHRTLNTQNQRAEAYSHGCYSDISFPNSVFLANIHAAYRLLLAQGVAQHAQFLDVGCGSGLKVLQATEFFKHTVGLEYDQGYAELAQSLLEQVRNATCHVIHGDGITFKNYADYNLVYFFRPMRDPAMLSKLENQITSTVQPGTILFAPYPQFFIRHKSLNCGKIGGSLYLAKSSQSQADTLREKAELTGTFYKKVNGSRPTIWDPIIQFSQQNGFALEN